MSHAGLLDIQAAQKLRAATEVQFEEVAKLEEKRQRIAVTEWLDCAKSQLDQLDAKAVREAYPQSGRWLLDRPQMKAWLDLQSEEKPLLWIRGIPGAGMYTTRLFMYRSLAAFPFIYRMYPDVLYLSLTTWGVRRS
jgi:hypothetical protein